ncbi:hypothetical protein YK56LOC_69120 [Caballeronia sp. HLA56]
MGKQANNVGASGIHSGSIRPPKAAAPINVPKAHDRNPLANWRQPPAATLFIMNMSRTRVLGSHVKLIAATDVPLTKSSTYMLILSAFAGVRDRRANRYAMCGQTTQYTAI